MTRSAGSLAAALAGALVVLGCALPWAVAGRPHEELGALDLHDPFPVLFSALAVLGVALTALGWSGFRAAWALAGVAAPLAAAVAFGVTGDVRAAFDETGMAGRPLDAGSGLAVLGLAAAVALGAGVLGWRERRAPRPAGAVTHVAAVAVAGAALTAVWAAGDEGLGFWPAWFLGVCAVALAWDARAWDKVRRRGGSRAHGGA